jgi:hypothetical protein
VVGIYKREKYQKAIKAIVTDLCYSYSLKTLHTKHENGSMNSRADTEAVLLLWLFDTILLRVITRTKNTSRLAKFGEWSNAHSSSSVFLFHRL